MGAQGGWSSLQGLLVHGAHPQGCKALETIRAIFDGGRKWPQKSLFRSQTAEAGLALWKDADPDIPILKEAKAEYEKLK